MRKLLTIAIFAGVLALAGCTVPQVADVGTVTPAPIVKTGPESPLIGAACRAELAGLVGGSSLVNATDVDLGFWVAEGKPADDPEVLNTLAGFRFGAVQLGATSCG